MYTHIVVPKLAHRFPGKPIICIPEKNTTEVICEVCRATNGAISMAMAVIGRSEPHKHNRTTEVYAVEQGRLYVYLNGVRYVLEAGKDPLVIEPGVVHWAESREAWVWVICTPAWTPEDHILVTETRPKQRNGGEL